MMNIATLTQVALSKILLKGHACLEAYTHFALRLIEDDGEWTLTFSAEAGWDRLFLDIKTFSSEAEAAAWLANGRVSTRVLNKTIAEHQLAHEEAQEFTEELEQAGEDLFLRQDAISTALVNGEHPIYRDWDWNAIEATSPFFYNMLMNELTYEGRPKVDTLAEVRRLRKMLTKEVARLDAITLA